ncbi:MAG TPA: alpha-galactosidase, partial [Blastocatellia bacterium]
ARAVEWFPAWAARWDVGGQAQWARWWQALNFDRTEQELSSTRTIHLGSRRHSSDDAGGGVNPYWLVGGAASRIYFGLQWSGGWSATLREMDNGFTYSVGLPPEETQLVLNRREAIEGPTLLVMPVVSADEADARALWMRQRYDQGRVLYGGPRASFPLTYNTWYAVGEAVDDDFLNRQVAAMPPYAFDAFVVDAGWFSDGRWKASKKKFPGNDLADMLAALKAGGIKAGLWSTPQYVSPASNSADLDIEDPPVTMRYFSGQLADLSSASFSDYVSSHVEALRANYSIDYWKYDQAFFTETSRAGEMKNVVGLQNALQTVRQNNPDLTIENCQSGGRMINEFTLLATQTSWLRDNKISGLDQPQSNISVALNALDFIFPWAALRFTNNFDEIDPSDDEMTRLYCRSAMIGRWGISTDLSLIGERQQNVILQEAENYRRLSPIKYACAYDLRLPSDEADAVGVTFYSGKRLRAGVLLYRWQRDGAFDQHVTLTKLKPELTYHVIDVDTGAEITASGSELMTNGIDVSFSSQRRSALLFIESVKATPAA